MQRHPLSPRRFLALGSIAAVAVIGVAAVALAAGGAHDSKVNIKLKCPRKVAGGGKTTCRVFGGLPKGPRGPAGAKGAKGAKGSTGAKGAAGSPGVSGYEVVSTTFSEVFVVNSGGQRGLSDVKTLNCPSGKRVIGGGADLGSSAAENGQQRQVTISFSGPNGNGTAWSAQLFNNSTSLDTSIDLKLYAICAKVG